MDVAAFLILLILLLKEPEVLNKRADKKESTTSEPQKV